MDRRIKTQEPSIVLGEIRPDAVDPPLSEAMPGATSEESLPNAAREVHRAFSRALQTRITSQGVSVGQWHFLRALWEEDGLTQRELSQRVGMMEPTTVTALNGMERQELVQRVRNPHDRRKVNIYLTPKGRALRSDVMPSADEIVELAMRGIPRDEIALAVSVLRRVTANLGSLPATDADDDLR